MRAAILLLLGFVPALAGTIDLVNLVSESSYRTFLDNTLFTHNGDSRNAPDAGNPAGPDHDTAAAGIESAFTSFGLTTSRHNFTWSGYSGTNIVGKLEGAGDSAGYFVLGAHYDSVAAGPGADDNASGVAGVLEAARVLSQSMFRSDIYFIAFDSEEDGLRGSWAWAAAHAADNILGMISLDMIGYNPAGTHYNQAYIYRYGGITSAQNALRDAFERYADTIHVELGVNGSSDHVPFANRGKPAALLIEHAVWSNPNYHRAGDSVDTANYIDYAYATELTRAVVGYTADGAGLVPEPGTAVLLVFAVAVFAYRKIAADRPA
jgi:aminopeptidase YwaD